MLNLGWHQYIFAWGSMINLKETFKTQNQDYRDFKRFFIKKQAKTLAIASAAVAIYSLIAPLIITAIFDGFNFKNLSKEFLVLGLTSLPISIGFFVICKLDDSKHEIKALLYEILAAAFFLGGGVTYNVLAIYMTVSNGDTPSYSATYIVLLIFISIFIIHPFNFALMSVVSLAAVLLEIKYVTPWATKEAYNFTLFAIISVVLYFSKYLQSYFTFRKSEEINKMHEEKQKFLISLTHEMRTPLNSVLGKNQIIQIETEDENIKKLSAQIGSSGKVLLSLINDILDLSKIESGKMNIVPTKYSLPRMIKDIEDIMVSEAEGRELEFISDLGDNLPTYLYGDEIRIKQIALNLISNAIKYTPEGSVRFIIRFEKKSDTEGVLSIAVKDTGLGIKKEDLSKLTKAFVRVDEEKNRLTQSTGLGLSISSNLLELMDSKLLVESEYGKGSTFSFNLPQKMVIEETENDEEEKAAKSEKRFSAPNAKILIVDDNRVNISVASRLMNLFDIKPESVTSGMACIEKLVDCKYDIIFLDHMMPDMDGIETFEKIKAEYADKCEGTVFVALTANAETDGKNIYTEMGFDSYLEKPIELSKLEKVLKKYL